MWAQTTTGPRKSIFPPLAMKANAHAPCDQIISSRDQDDTEFDDIDEKAVVEHREVIETSADEELTRQITALYRGGSTELRASAPFVAVGGLGAPLPNRRRLGRIVAKASNLTSVTRGQWKPSAAFTNCPCAAAFKDFCQKNGRGVPAALDCIGYRSTY